MVQTIQCPRCGTEIPLTEAISGRLSAELRQEYESKAQELELKMAK
jgi:hypothetical protein